jgi:signal transduction histidine kinase
MLILKVDEQGCLLSESYNDGRHNWPLEMGKDISHAMHIVEQTQFRSFLQAIEQEHVTFDWRFQCMQDDENKVLFFHGILMGNYRLILSSEHQHECYPIIDLILRAPKVELSSSRNSTTGPNQNSNSGFGTKRQSQGELESLLNEMSDLNNELVRAQRDLVKKKQELERLNDYKNHLLGVASHDMRNPISAISGLSEFMLEEDPGELSEDQKEVLNAIHDSSQHLFHLLNNLLDVSSIEMGQLELHTDLASLDVIAQKSVDLNSVLARKKDITLNYEKVGSINQVPVDAQKMTQVFNNLLSNAIKYSPRGSTVDIRLSKSEDWVTFEVADEGVGIPQNEQENLFTPFAEISSKPTNGEKSTGLGLSIASKIVEAHQGEISVASDVGEGTTFTVRIPQFAAESQELKGIELF